MTFKLNAAYNHQNILRVEEDYEKLGKASFHVTYTRPYTLYGSGSSVLLEMKPHILILIDNVFARKHLHK